jgi:hypothetical protein
MHNLVKEASGIDFTEFGDNLEAAKEATLRTIGSSLEDKDKLAIGNCPSIGHVLNEVSLISTRIAIALIAKWHQHESYVKYICVLKFMLAVEMLIFCVGS